VALAAPELTVAPLGSEQGPAIRLGEPHLNEKLVASRAKLAKMRIETELCWVFGEGEDQGEESGRFVGTHAGRTAVIADTHPLWLDALEALLERVELSVAGRATTVEDTRRLVVETRPDLMIAECAMAIDSANGSEGGKRLLEQVREAHPRIRCIVLSDQDDPREREVAFAAGADAFCVKWAESEDLAAVVRQLFSPSFYLARSQPAAPTTSSQPMSDAVSLLTKREREILRLAAEGHSNSELAKMLWVTEQTVKFHLSNIYRKLEVSNRTEASRWAHHHGLLKTPEPHTPAAA
jgi:two-component system response regulator DevR